MAKKSTKTKHTSKHQDLLPIIGIGASAGGLNALKKFFSKIPEDSGLAFVIVVHLSPEHKSVLADLLQPNIKMPVQQVTKNMALKPNHVYVIPPNANLNTIDTHLRLSKLEERRSERAPIDHFFRTLANTHQNKAIGLILSGTGSDGTLGLKEIKEKGGLTMVQEPTEAEYDGMPQSAISTGLVDLVLPLAEMPGYLLKFINTRPRLKIVEDGEKAGKNERSLINRVFAQIKARTGRDFTRYKISTITRRLQRRMQIYQMEELEEYLELLRKNPEEVRALSDDLLINVTNFFRDPPVFEHIENKVIPNILQNKTTEDEIRIWSVGCATGEEAYSLAILMTEAMEDIDNPPEVQIFASDLHEHSLKKAREGFFPGDISKDISPKRLKRFFTKDDGGYRIRKEIREQVVFTPHNLLGDPPFSRLDMLVCRNLLIYLKRDVQKDIFDLFHYAIRPHGYLVLGTSENIETNELFQTESKEFSVFRKKNIAGPEPKLPVFPRISTRFDEKVSKAPEQESVSHGELHHKLVEKYGPPSILLNPEYEVLHVSENAGRYLKVQGGEFSRDLFKLVRSELSIELRSILYQAKEEKTSVRSNPLKLNIDGETQRILISVRVIDEPDNENMILVMFEELDTKEKAPGKRQKGEGDSSTLNRVKELEEELNEKRQQLQAIIEEYETSREEMKASNEELQSANEELRSTMEELETSKEELQSVNEELTTLNQENRHKVEELSQVTDDLQNLLASTQIATLFLNREFRIMRYTPRLGELFSIRPADRGRPISDITNKLNYDHLVKDAERVIENLQPAEREIKDKEGKTYMSRILPYRSTDDRIEGVVVTFIDISERKNAETLLAKNEERFRAIATTMFNLLYRMSPDWSEMYELEGKGFLADTTEPDKKWMQKYIHPDDQKQVKRAIAKAIEKKEMFSLVHRVIRKDGTLGWTSSRAVPLFDEKGEISEWIGAANDITAEKEAGQKLKDEKIYAENIVETLHEPLLVLNPDLTVKSVNQAFYDHFEVKKNETIGCKIYELGNNQWNIPALRELLEDVLPDSNVFTDFEVDHEFEDIGRKIMLVNARRLDHVQLILLGIRDITDRKQAEEMIRSSEERLRLTVDATGIGTWVRNEAAESEYMDENNISLLGLSKKKTKYSSEEIYKCMHPEDRGKVKSAVQKAWQEKGEFNIEFRVGTKNKYRWLASRGRIIDSGGASKMIGINFDITERKKQESELRIAKDKYRNLFNSIDAGFCIIQVIFNDKDIPVDYRFLEVNPAFEKHSGIKNAQGKCMSQFEPEHEKHWFEIYGRIAKTGKPESFVNHAKHLGDRWFDVFAFRVGSPQERKVAVLFNDISEEKKYQKELSDARKQAEKAARAKEDFLAHMSHEIRTPLNAVAGLSHLLLKHDHLPEQRENLHNLKIAADNLNRLINDILDFSKIQSGKVQLDIETININKFIDEIFKVHRTQADEKGLKLEYELDQQIPKVLKTDGLKLSHVLHNLLSNAVKFTPEGFVHLELKLIKKKKKDLWLEFIIRDSGIGIPCNKQDRIFDVFSQADNSTVRTYGGTGLGLTITKLYLEMMGSSIKVESEENKGSVFSFVLRLEENGEPAQISEQKYESVHADMDLKKLCILIVEDDEYNRMIMEQLFDMWEVEYDTAGNGEQAVKQATENKYDLILMDVRMPVMDGYEATRKIRELPAYENVPVIALTADVSQSVKNEVKKGLFDDLSLKPVDPEKMNLMIRKVLAKRKETGDR